ncbi:MFS transporter [Ktedonospora formicarum]|uniref:MFS transporter n=1 Tax=Ktedonospora formicarum TaxID=2778364 RepID=A0A8J3MVT9_9CHLR|nr:MFS transporter [Ktedonospora formicarum]GHO47998.1 MFS transporter [Ktedonospora formicarum]
MSSKVERLAGDAPQQVVAADWRRWAGLIVLCVALFLEALNFSSVNVQIPAISEDLGLTTVTAQFLVSTYQVAYAGFLLLGGRISDLVSRRLVFISSVAVFGVASLAAGLAGNPTILIAARAVQGIAAAFTTPAAMAIITATFPEGPERNKAMGIYGMVGGSGFAIGALLSGMLTSLLNWRWGFFDYVIITVLVIALTPALVAKSERPSSATRGIDFAGAFSVTAGLLLLVYTIGEAHSAPVGLTIGGLVAAIILLIGFVVIESRVRTPILPLGVLRLPTLASANIIGFIQYVGFTGVVFISTLYLQNVLGYTPFQTGLAFLPLGLEAAIFSNLAPPLVNRIGIKPTLIIGMVLFTAGIAIMPWMLTTNGTFWNIILPHLLLGGGLSLAFPAVVIAAMSESSATNQGLTSGLITTAGQLGGALGLAVIIFVAAVFTPVVVGAHPAVQAVNQALVTGFQPALLLAAVIGLLGIVVALVGFKGPKPSQPEQAMSSESIAD